MGPGAPRSYADRRRPRGSSEHVGADVRSSIQAGDRHHSASLAAAPADSKRPATARKERPADRLDRGVGGPADSSNAARTLSTDAQDDADRLPSSVLRRGATGRNHQSSIAGPIFAATVRL